MTKSTNVWIGLLSLLVWGCGAEEGTSVDSAPEASVPVPGVPETVPGPTVEGTPVESETTEEEPSEEPLRSPVKKLRSTMWRWKSPTPERRKRT